MQPTCLGRSNAQTGAPPSRMPLRSIPLGRVWHGIYTRWPPCGRAGVNAMPAVTHASGIPYLLSTVRVQLVAEE